MIHEDEDALICDFAETYQIYDYRSLPVKMAATLAAGLRDDSRIAKTTEAKASTTNTILAIIADHLACIRNALGDKTEFPSVVGALYELEPKVKTDKVKAYRDSSAFMTAWQEINED